MIAVSTHPIKIYYSPAYNDMSHFHLSDFDVNDWFYMDLNDYIAKLEFANFDMNPNLPPEEVKNISEIVKSGKEVDFITSPYYYRMNQLIKDAGGYQVWQFNAINKNLDGYVRQIVVLGGKGLHRVSWFDRKIKYSVYKYIVKILNKCLYFQHKKEQKEWDDFMDNMGK